jgi:beta-fructofuranosidase
LAGRWIWDFWIVDHDGRYHAFYLQAPSSLGDPELRHWNATIGHSVSTDLVNWEPMEDALRPGSGDSWDSMATWTGSIIRLGEEWRMYYTGVSTAEDGLVQRIGFANSCDLVTWRKHPANPVIETDPQWYETLDAGAWVDQAWRDPWIHTDGDGTLSAYITARVGYGPPDGRGVIALATSSDGLDWAVMPPISEPGDFASLEVPQLVVLGDRSYLVFSVRASETSEARRRTHAALSGVHYLEGLSPRGPFRLASGPFLTGDAHGTRYAGKVIEHRGQLVLMTSHHGLTSTGYVAVLGDPQHLRVTEDGKLALDGPAAQHG